MVCLGEVVQMYRGRQRKRGAGAMSDLGELGHAVGESRKKGRMKRE